MKNVSENKIYDWRPCGYFQKLNSMTIPDKYPIPYLMDFSASLHDCKVFSKIDLVREYNQIPVEEEDIPKTAIITSFGLFEFLRMPFSLRNAANTFQMFIDKVTQDLHFVFAYINDFLITSPNEEIHRKHLEQLFERLAKYKVVINASKCVFGVESISFLGHIVDKERIRPMLENVAAIEKYSLPTSLQKLCEYLGLINFYRRFIKNCTETLFPLTELLKNRKKKNEAIQLNDKQIKAFIEIKEKLKSVTLMAHPVPNADLSLIVDASNVGISGVLQQNIQDSW